MVLSFSQNSVELPGEVARLLSELREENRALWREVTRLGGRVPAHVSSAANNLSNCGPASAPASFGGTSLPPQSQTSSQSPQSQSRAGLARGHVLSHSRSSSNLGDDGERDGEWEDEDGNGDLMSGVGMGIGGGAGNQGADEWDSQGSRLAFGGGLSVPGTNSQFSFNNSLGAGPGVGAEWKRWVEVEMNDEKNKLEKLVSVVKAFVNVVGNGGEVLGSGGAGARGDGGGEGGSECWFSLDYEGILMVSPFPVQFQMVGHVHSSPKHSARPARPFSFL
ncbi:hypothetical protein PAXRUDRAFT_633547 [Paxillus rubicundulus Ve08.2h10]|uniref:Uncharacterized protein n=1 Tax=Paxillus rubicundulus Ve08.2h10 TaxID=930991 RepID=A0A0D0E376_9AGAM|nr:hypothetical protein PAXRUDRAFT_633547 [Paxillus rubicundulus Ve08.2h10]